MVKNDKRKVGTSIKILLCRYKHKFVLLHSMKTCEGVAVQFASRARLYGLKEVEIAGPHTSNRPGDWMAVACRLWNTLPVISTSCQVIYTYSHSVSSMRFAAETNVKKVVTSWLQTFDTNFWLAVIPAFVVWWGKCLNVSYDSLEVWRVPAATYL